MAIQTTILLKDLKFKRDSAHENINKFWVEDWKYDLLQETIGPFSLQTNCDTKNRDVTSGKKIVMFLEVLRMPCLFVQPSQRE